ncbi:MAG: hypothetical protein ACKOCW_04055 [Planctomycetaceae bacterium]
MVHRTGAPSPLSRTRKARGFLTGADVLLCTLPITFFLSLVWLV